VQYDITQLRIHAEDLAQTGAKAVVERLELPDATRARTKSTATDYVTACDPLSEASIRQRARELWGQTDHSFTGEETGAEPSRPGALRLIVDGVDGTANLFAGAPEFGVSVAIAVDGRVIAAAVAEPMSGRVYSAGLGLGARLYDPSKAPYRRPLDARGVGRPLSQRLVATGYSYQPDERRAQALVMAQLISKIEDQRRCGSAVMDLCRTADGVYGAYYEHHLNEWDWAAGLLICEEAGATVNWPGTGGIAAHLGDPIFACAPELAEDLLQLLADAGAADLAAPSSIVQHWLAGHAS
jgi:myo-inositol-1(or 4)-monophosphatase